MKKRAIISVVLLLTVFISGAQESTYQNKFQPLKQEMATPNVYRTASGAPGHEYWQQKADYNIKIRLDDKTQQIFGEETVTYHNQSPDVLNYLWLQLDQNMRARDSDSKLIRTSEFNNRVSFMQVQRMDNEFDGGFKLDFCKRQIRKQFGIHGK